MHDVAKCSLVTEGSVSRPVGAQKEKAALRRPFPDT